MAVQFEPDRVTAVWAPGKPTGMIGSGYLLDDGLVLTAGHVVDHAEGRACEVRPLGGREWLAAERVWRGERCDAALLRLADRSRGDDAIARLGRIGHDERVACRALGFPFAQARERGEVRDTEDLAGEIAPLTGRESGLLAVHVAGSVPTPDGSGHSPWEGMSGAALFSGPLIVGVIVLDPADFGTDRLEAVPTTAMIAEPGFREALTGDPDAAVALAAVEDLDRVREALDAPYRPLPVEASPAALAGGATAFLLEPEYGIVPFHGREDELAELQQWCTGDRRLVVRLLTGGGGTGKTRVAAELCRRQALAGVVTGFLNAQAAERVSELARITAPLLVVIDEAPSRLELACAVIRELARARRAAPARVLLLARQAGDWWPTTLDEQLDDPDARFALAAAATPRELPPIEPRPREQTFLAAAHAFAARLGRSLSDPRAPDLTAPVFEPILFVHLAALSLAEGEHQLPRGRVMVADDLLAFALRREARYWASTARAHGLGHGRSVLEQAVAVATLTTASSVTEAATALAAIPDLADESGQASRRSVARWLRDLYPAEPAHRIAGPQASHTAVAWFRPLVPDLLGEALLATVLAEDRVPELASNLLGRSRPEQTHRILTVLTHAARAHPTVQRALRQTLADHLPALWTAAVTVAQQAGDPLGSLLAGVLEHTPAPDLAAEIADSLPRDTVALRELAEVATRQAFEHAASQPSSPDRDATVAQLKCDHAVRLSRLGRREEALAAIEEAVEVYRRLADARADAFLPALATSLNNRSIMLSDLGRREEALPAIEQAVTIRRRLADARPDAFLPALAISLNNHAGRLSDLGRREEALAAIEQAVTIRRRLADARPDAFLPDLAISLNNHAGRLSDLGRREEALAAIEQAVEVYRRLADARPDAFLPALAISLNNHAGRLSDLGRREEALAAIEQAVTIRRRLADARPDAFLPALAISLNNHSGCLSDLGRREEALAAIEQAVTIRRRLADARPDAFLPALAMSLNNHAGRLSDLGRREEALAAIEEAVTIGRQLADARPDAFLPDLAMSLNNHAGRLSDLGRREEALAAIEQAVTIRRQLADARPDAFLPDLAMSLDNQSNMLSDLGRREEALAAIEEAVTIRRQLADARPDAFLPDLAMSLNNHSNRLSDLGRREEALAAIEEAVTIRRQLADARPDAFLPDLAMSLNNHSNRLSALGRREEALAAIEEAVEVYRQLADARPDAFLPDLAGSLNNHSNRLHDLGREEALAAIEEAVEVYRRLADARPDAFLPDLAMSLNNQSNMLSDLGGREEALGAIEEAVEVYRRLADARPDAFLPDLAGSLNNHSGCLSALGRREEALAAIEQAVTIRRQLADARPDAFLPDLAMSLNNQSNTLSDLGRREEALGAIEEAVEVYRRLADARPDAFLPDLAGSLNNHSGCLSALGRREEALATIHDAIQRVLPMLERDPYVLPDSGLRLAQSYLELCEQTGLEPDEPAIQRLHAVLVSVGIVTAEE